MTRLYNETCRYVFGLAWRILGDRCAAEEVVIDVYMQVWRQAALYDERRGKPHAWLMTIARSRAIDRRRADKQARLRAVTLEVAGNLMTTIPNPEVMAGIGEQRQLVQAALDALPPEQREVIEQVYFFGLSHSEVAAKLGQPLGTVKTRARLAMKKLREALGPILRMNHRSCSALRQAGATNEKAG